MAKAPMKVAIVGGSIGGLASAVAFHRLGATVRVFEKAAGPFTGRGGSLGFCQVPLWEALRDAPMLRRGQRANRAQGGWIYGDLWQFLFEGLPPGAVVFNTTVADLGADPTHPSVGGETFDLAIVADGGWSSLRGLYFEQTRPVYAGYQVWRFRVQVDQVPGFKAFGEYNKEHYMTILLDICQNKGPDFIMGGTTVAAPEADIIAPTSAVNRQGAGDEAGLSDVAAAPTNVCNTQEWFLKFFETKFSSAAGGEALRVMRAAAQQGKLTPLPQFEFAASRVVTGRIVLLGDAAHMASPRTASGAHTAVLDAYNLLEIFSKELQALTVHADVGAAIDRGLATYAPQGLARAQQLVARSKQVSADVVAPGFVRANQLFVPPTMA